MTDLEQAEKELNEAVQSIGEAHLLPDPPRAHFTTVYLHNYAEKRRAYGVACHAIKCDLCRSVRHADECWERKLILGEL